MKRIGQYFSQIVKNYIAYKGRIVLLVSFFLLSFANASAYANQFMQQEDSTDQHELTLYAVAPKVSINWGSPSSLYKTVKQNVFKVAIKPHRSTLGHMFFSLKTNLLPKTLWAGFTVFRKADMFKEVLFIKSGLSSLGKPFKAKIENGQTLEKSIKSNSKEHNIAFITYRLNKEATLRILTFLSILLKEVDNELIPSTYYSGNSWPLYFGEGSDCSALIVAALELAGLPPSEREPWKIALKVPVSLIGGSLNHHSRIKIRSIRKTKTWYQGNGEAGVEYADFETIDPSRVRKWILQAYNQTPQGYKKVTQGNIPGLYRDYRSVNAHVENPMFSNRKEVNFFLKNNPLYSNNQADSVYTTTDQPMRAKGGVFFNGVQNLNK